MIRLTGVNATTDELRLPAETAGTTGLADMTDSAKIWADAGFRPAMVRGAWETLVGSFERHFPEKSFGLALIPNGAFPGIDDKGNPAPRPLINRNRLADLNAALSGLDEHTTALTLRATPNRPDPRSGTCHPFRSWRSKAPFIADDFSPPLTPGQSFSAAPDRLTAHTEPGAALALCRGARDPIPLPLPRPDPARARPIQTFAFPALGTGFGGMPFDEAARQMAVAYAHSLRPPHRLDWDTVVNPHKAISYDGNRRVTWRHEKNEAQRELKVRATFIYPQ
jgi:hypothetical protein